MMKEKAKVSPVTRAGFFLLLLIFALFAFTQFGKPLRIDTNLKDLSPQLTEDRALQHAVATLSSAIENRFTLVVTGSDQGEVDGAAKILADGLSAVDDVSVTAGDQTLSETVVNQLASYRFGLLTAAQVDDIQTKSSEQLIAASIEKLYQVAGGVSVLPLDQDPFGWFGEYLVSRVTPPSASVNDTTFIPVYVTLADGGLNTSVQERLQSVLAVLEAEVRMEYPEVDRWR